MHYFSNLFWYRTLHVSDRFTVRHQESSTVNTAMGIFHTDYADCLLAVSITCMMTKEASWKGIVREGLYQVL
jgi:hypothetical protein